MTELIWEQDPTIKLNCTIEPATLSVNCNGVQIKLTESQFKVFECIHSRSPYVVTRTMIFDTLGTHYSEDSKIIDVFLTQIKKLMRKQYPEAERFLQNVAGRGFKLSGATPIKRGTWCKTYKIWFVKSVIKGEMTVPQALARHPDMSTQELMFLRERYEQLGVSGLAVEGYRPAQEKEHPKKLRIHFK